MFVSLCMTIILSALYKVPRKILHYRINTLKQFLYFGAREHYKTVTQIPSMEDFCVMIANISRKKPS